MERRLSRRSDPRSTNSPADGTRDRGDRGMGSTALPQQRGTGQLVLFRRGGLRGRAVGAAGALESSTERVEGEFGGAVLCGRSERYWEGVQTEILSHIKIFTVTVVAAYIFASGVRESSDLRVLLQG